MTTSQNTIAPSREGGNIETHEPTAAVAGASPALVPYEVIDGLNNAAEDVRATLDRLGDLAGMLAFPAEAASAAEVFLEVLAAARCAELNIAGARRAAGAL